MMMRMLVLFCQGYVCSWGIQEREAARQKQQQSSGSGEARAIPQPLKALASARPLTKTTANYSKTSIIRTFFHLHEL